MDVFVVFVGIIVVGFVSDFTFLVFYCDCFLFVIIRFLFIFFRRLSVTKIS